MILRRRLSGGEAGFAVTAILYLLALMGVAGAVLYSGTSQTLRTQIEISRHVTAKNDLLAGGRTLSAASTLANGGLTLQPPAVLDFAAVPAADLGKLPTGYANVGSTGSPTNAGVIAPAVGSRQLDPWNHFYLYCRWDNPTHPGTDPAAMLISAGPDGVLDTACGDSAAQQDDLVERLSVANSIDRANVWQYQTVTGGPEVQFGINGNAVHVTSSGDISANSLTLAGSLNAGAMTLAAPLPVSQGGTGGNTASTARANLGSGVIGDSVFTAATAAGARGVLGSTTIGDSLFTAASAAAARGTLGSTTVGDAVFIAATTTAGRAALGGTAIGSAVFTATDAAAARAALGSTSVGDAVFVAEDAAAARAALGDTAVGDALFTAATATAARVTLGAGTTGDAVFRAPNQTAALTALGLIGGSATLDVSISGTANTAAYLADGANILSGAVPIAHGGTGATTAATARTNLGADDASNLTTGTLSWSRLPTSGVSAGTYNWGTVNAYGIVTSANNLTSNTLVQNDSGITVNDTTPGAGTDGQIVFTTEGTTQAVMDYRGYLGLATATPQDRLHIAGGSTGNSIVRLEGAVATDRLVRFTTGAGKRWELGTDSTAEGGSDVGSDFVIRNFNDAGTLLGTPFIIDRATGNITISGSITATSFVGAGGGGGSLVLGASAAASNPARTGEANTGLFTSGSGIVNIAGLGTEVARFSSAGIDARTGAFLLGGVQGLKLTAIGNPIVGNTAMNEALAPVSIAIGRNALASVAGEVYAVAIGDGALFNTTTGISNTALGISAMRLNITGSNNTALGYAALFSNTTGDNNAALGYQALRASTTGINNTAVGYQALKATITGSGNVAVGALALSSNINGNYQTAVGEGALFATTSGSGNTAVGNAALISNTTGIRNTGLGYSALYSNTTGDYNVAVGFYALGLATTSSGQVAVGRQALASATTATSNTAVGHQALTSATTGSGNTALGYGAGDAVTTGSYNIAVGLDALGAATTATGNTAVGYQALKATTTGSNNTAIGYRVGSATLATGSNNILIGTSSAVDTPTAATSNWLNIGNVIFGSTATAVPQLAIGSGIAALASGVTFDLGSNTDSMRLPLGTTAQRPGTGAQGMVRYNTTTGAGAPEYYDGSTWQSLVSTFTGGSIAALGATATGTNPQRSGEAGTGLFSAATGQVSVASNGVEVGRFDAAGLQLTTVTGAYQINGMNALKLTTTGNPVIGNTAMNAALVPESVAIGRDALASAAGEVHAVAVGHRALSSTLAGSNANAALGYEALANSTTGYSNTAVGYAAQTSTTTGSENTAVGSVALSNNTTGMRNTAVGAAALISNDTGDSNTAVGYQSLDKATAGSGNTAVGGGALYRTTTGSYNTAVGYQVGYYGLTTGSNNILIGTSSTVSTPAASTSNWLNIGNTIYGDTSNHQIAVGSGLTALATGVIFDLGSNTSSMRLPLGTTAQRPGTGAKGMVRYNTTTGAGVVEYHDGSAWQTVGTAGAATILGSTATGANPQRSGDATTGLFSPAAGSVAVSAAGAEALRVTATGSVGIGTASPGQPLTVNGRIETDGGMLFNQGSSATDNLIYAGATTATAVDASFGFFVAGVGSSAAIDGPYFLARGNNFGQISNQRGNVLFVAGSPSSPGALEGSIQFWTNNENFRSILTGSGQFGLGVTSPSYDFSLLGTAAKTLGMERHTTADTAGNNLAVQAGGATSGATNKSGGNLVLSSGIATGTGSSQIWFQTAVAGSSGTTDRSPATRMIIDGSGNVGIGTASPQATLDVNGYARLAKNNAQPVACAAANDGAIALTSQYTLCACNGGTTNWVRAADGTTACTW